LNGREMDRRNKRENCSVQKQKREQIHIYRVTDNAQIRQMSRDTRGNPVPCDGRDAVVMRGKKILEGGVWRKERNWTRKQSKQKK